MIDSFLSVCIYQRCLSTCAYGSYVYTEIVHLKNNIVVATTVVVVGTKKVLCCVVVYISTPSIEGNTF